VLRSQMCSAAEMLMAAPCVAPLQLNFMVRALIKVVFGATLAPGSHVEALAAYERAVDLAPQRLIHRVELARAALRLGQTMRAARELQVRLGFEGFPSAYLCSSTASSCAALRLGQTTCAAGELQVGARCRQPCSELH